MADSKQDSLQSVSSGHSSLSSLKSLSPISASKSFQSVSNGYNKSEWISKSVAETMIWSDFGLSLFDSPLNRQQSDVVCTQLTDLNCAITAIWVVARPLNYEKNAKFQHWAIKIQAPPILISLDFLEVKKSGYIRFEQTVASNVELKDFLFYYYNDKTYGRRRKKWKILASVTPSPLHDTSYLQTLDDYDVKTLKIYMNKHKKKRKKKQENVYINKPMEEEKVIDFIPPLKAINCKKRVCDIADFISMWTQSNHDNSQLSKSNKDKSYNAIICNCQQFVADLFHFLIGQKHSEKSEAVYDLRDIQVGKRKKKKTNLLQRVYDTKETSVTYSK